MLISRKRNPLQRPVLSVCGQVLEQVEFFSNFGMLLTSDLTWSKHTESKCAKAKKLLGMIYRRFSEYSNPDTLLHMYESMVQLHLEYASQVWDPHLQKDICFRESKSLHSGCVERTMAWTMRIYFRVSNCLNCQQGDFISDCHDCTWVIFFFSQYFCTHELNITSCKTSHVSSTFCSYQFLLLFICASHYFISAWNALPGYVTNMTTSSTFKNAFISSLYTP